MKKFYSVLKGTGSYIPTEKIPNEKFLNNEFFDKDGSRFDRSNEETVEKFQKITNISERRYIADHLVTSDIASYAAEDVLTSAGVDKETLDYIIVGHNYGDVDARKRRVDTVPTLASRVKYKLGIVNPYTVAYDLPFGCPGWLQAVIQADYYIKSGDARRIMVIGAESLSRVSDPHDRDSMLYSDGAGAVILEARESEEPIGILGHVSRSDTLEYCHMLYMDKSYNPNFPDPNDIFLKMNGRKLYQYALEKVPVAIGLCLEKAGVRLEQVKKLFIHQANGKMDEAILKRLYKHCNVDEIPDEVMPMTIDWLGNSSVATIPTVLDLFMKKKMKSSEVTSGDHLLFASVGAGMNINSVVYKIP